MKHHVSFSLLLGCIICLWGCESVTPDRMTPTAKSLLTGKVQKGPFVEGSSVYIFSLGDDFSQTGTTYRTTIIDRQGAFEQRDMQLSSQFVELEATGYYFNEVKGELSSAPLTLSAIADVSSADNVNANILTTLERERILYLIADGMNFAAAKQRAHREVLAVFGMTPAEVEDAVTLDVEADVQLLAVSAIVQGMRPAAEVTRLIATIASDLRADGTLDDMSAASALKNNAMGIDADKLVANMAEYDMTFAYTADQVAYWLGQFEANTQYEQTEFITYPDIAEYGRNILAGGTFQAGEAYSFAAVTPAWSTLKVEVRGWAWAFEVMPNAPQNWKAGDLVEAKEGYYSRTFEVVKPGEESILKFVVEPYYYVPSPDDPYYLNDLPEDAPAYGTIKLIFYENSDIPTREMVVNISNTES